MSVGGEISWYDMFIHMSRINMANDERMFVALTFIFILKVRV